MSLHEKPVGNVFITDELDRRPPRKTDYLQEKLALQDLAALMADKPEEVLPRFVDLAMQITGAVSAGVSLYEEDPAPGVFRWRYLRGMLEPFNGATTPRNFSPCGVTLDQNRPVLSLHPERVYDWIAAANIVVPEVLLVPLYLGGAEPLGTLWIVSAEVGHFDSGHARIMTELAAFVGIALRMVRNEERVLSALEQQQILAKEMSHRVKNLFALAEGMVRFSAKSASSVEEMAKVLSGRLYAMAAAHELIRRDAGDVSVGGRVSDLEELVRKILQPHEGYESNGRNSVAGSPVRLANNAINGLALVVHELATNAAKYGALSDEAGSVAVAWTVADGRLRLEWTERGGPAVEGAPAAQGFGGSLLDMIVVRQLGGTARYDWAPTGMAVVIDLPADHMLAAAAAE